MNHLYPVVNPNFHLHLTASDCTLFYIIRSQKAELGLSDFKQWKIDPLMARYLLLCTGIHTHQEIANQLRVPLQLLLDHGAKYLQEATNVITLSSTPSSEESSLFITGTFQSYNPLHVSLEVTDCCNFRCKHCYVSACPEKQAKRNYADTISLFDHLWDHGVKVIELTGGECTTHPQFKEILTYAANKFNLVAVVSNGYILGENKELANHIGTLKNVAVQISLDGLQEYHDTFRGMPGAFDHAVKAIQHLKAAGCLTRIATTITEENLADLLPLFHLCKELEADSFAVSTVSSFGRGAQGNEYQQDLFLKNKIRETLLPYADDPLFKANQLAVEAVMHNKELNCGAGWRTFAINGATGNVRICLFLNELGIIGNIDSDSYESIFSCEKLTTFRNAISPTPSLDTCKGCPYAQQCNGCMARAINIASTLYPQCPWVKKYGIPL